MVDNEKPSVFKLIFRYMNRNPTPVVAEIVVTPDNGDDEEQMATVNFPVTGE